MWRAAGRLGIPVQAAAPAAEAGLVEFGTRVRFRHPLVRSAAYRSAPAQQMQDDARARWRRPPTRRPIPIAGPGTGPRPRPGPDEDVAAELERSAGRAQARGGLAAAAAFLERAALLTPDPVRRAQRLLAAARAKRDAGELDAALGLLVVTEAGPLDALQAAEVARLRGQIAFDQDAAATRPGCCWARPGSLSRWTPVWPARRTWRRSGPRCSPVIWACPAACGRRPRPRAPRRPAPTRRARSTSCSTRSRCGSRRDTRRPRRR